MQPAFTSTSIRLIQPNDNPFMAQIIRQVMTEYGAVGEGYSINDPEVDSMYEHYQGPRHAFFVIDAAGQIVGGAGIAPLQGGEEGVCELRKMYLLPVVRGLGLGRQILDRCLDTAREKMFHTCYLETLDRMSKARQLYLAAGFKSLSGPLGYTGHGSCDAWYALEL